MADQGRNELGAFLRARRAALTPDETGVSATGKGRVQGLRREEVALLAGISVKYYTQLEQGESHQVSDSVLEAIGRALRLDSAGRRHLARLAWPTQLLRREDSEPETVRDSLVALVEGTADVAALLLGRQMDLLGGNRLGYALFGLRPGQEANMALLTFLEPTFRDLLVDWETEARSQAANLRMATAKQPDDRRLTELIGKLSIKSHDFVRLWSETPVTECAHSVQYDHPLVGRLSLTEDSLNVPDDTGQQISFQCAAPGSDSAERLRLLDSLVA